MWGKKALLKASSAFMAASVNLQKSQQQLATPLIKVSCSVSHKCQFAKPEDQGRHNFPPLLSISNLVAGFKRRHLGTYQNYWPASNLLLRKRLTADTVKEVHLGNQKMKAQNKEKWCYSMDTTHKEAQIWDLNIKILFLLSQHRENPRFFSIFGVLTW